MPLSTLFGVITLLGVMLFFDGSFIGTVPAASDSYGAQVTEVAKVIITQFGLITRRGITLSPDR